jgi:glycyl-tRNA synthetase
MIRYYFRGSQPRDLEEKRMNNSEKTMDKIVKLCKNRGYIFSGSEIYGGLANTWDYGLWALSSKTT